MSYFYFLRALGDTNRGTRYELKVVGDSPEMCRGLDAYGFADFIRSCEHHRVLTSDYDIDDPRRFNFGTPSEAWHTMERCWTLEPTSDRIIQDIGGLWEVLDKVIEHEGCVIPECRLRSGVRQMKHNGGRVLKHKVPDRQRKGFKGQVVHVDAHEAIQMLLKGPQVVH
jgi:hypothetical protein